MARKEIDTALLAEKQEILTQLDYYHRRWNRALVEKAFDFAVDAHRDHRRQSGEPYVSHPIAVAKILIDIKTDYTSVVGALLHDVVEDTAFTIDDIKEQFGEQVAMLVHGVTKISELHFRSSEERQAETIRKIMLSMLKDLRVILIKLADRLHNMRTLEALPKRSQKRIASETRDIYAPLAHRLGIARWAREMEELALRVLDPSAYEEIVSRVVITGSQRQAIIDEFINPIKRDLFRQGIVADIHGRVKGIASIYKKIHDRKKSFDEIHDMLAVRIIVNNKAECYRVLGLVHELFTPVIDHFADYIALPKTNLYQSLHTKVRDNQNRIVEVQIRTHEMHAIAENGIAAHWRYKEGQLRPDELDNHFSWIRSLMELHQESAENGDFLESLKIDLFKEEIFVFTPKGKLIQLPSSATPVDFAFAIHTDVGMHAISAKVGGKIVSLNEPLHSGDVVEILTSPNQKPSIEWLKTVRTSRASNHIKKWFRDTKVLQYQALGFEMLAAEVAQLKLKLDEEIVTDVAASFGCNTNNDLYTAIGSGNITVGNVMHKLIPLLAPDKESIISRIIPWAAKGTPGVRVSGLDNMAITIADCCNPLPGDPIIGFIMSGQGLQVHRTDCPQVASLIENEYKMMTVAWDTDKEERFKARVIIVAEDRLHLMRDVAEVISSLKINLLRIDFGIEDKLAVGHLTAEVRNLPQLTRLIARINQVRGVLKVERENITAPNSPIEKSLGTVVA